MSSDDLVRRLREYRTEDDERYDIDHPICNEAADEIERLRAALSLIGCDCTNFRKPFTCWLSGRVAGAEFGADAVCDQCIAARALADNSWPNVISPADVS